MQIFQKRTFFRKMKVSLFLSNVKMFCVLLMFSKYEQFDRTRNRLYGYNDLSESEWTRKPRVVTIRPRPNSGYCRNLTHVTYRNVLERVLSMVSAERQTWRFPRIKVNREPGGQFLSISHWCRIWRFRIFTDL